MKKFRYIIPVILVIASSCTSQLYTGTTDDDLYYRPSGEPVVAVQTTTPAGTTDQYYDNMLAGDTLIADDYVPSEAYLSGTGADASVVNNYYGASAAERIYLFNDGFYPYWDYYSPFSFSMSYGYGFGSGFGWGYPYYGYGYGGYYPYYRYGYGGYYPYYGYGYGGYYDPYWGYGYGGYSPYYGSNYPNYNNNDGSSRYMARRGGYSTVTRGSYTTEGDGRIKSGIPAESSYSRRTGSASPSASPAQGGSNTATRRPAAASEKSTYTRSSSVPNSGLTNGQGYTRRDPSGTNTQAGTQSGTQTRTQAGTQTRTPQSPAQGQTQSLNRPQYQTTDRAYTPSYNSPRMSSKPSYNNSRTSEPVQGTTNPNRGTTTRSSSGSSSSGYTPSRSSSSSVQYSSPSRSSSGSSGRSSSGGSSYSGGSRSSSGSSYSSGSRSSSSGSSGGYSGGSSSSGSSSSSSSSSSHSGGGGSRR